MGYCQVNLRRRDQTAHAAYSSEAHLRFSLPSSSLPEIISHSVWLYFRFALSFRDVEEMLKMRGVTLSYETIREWCLKFGQTYANGLRRRSSQPGDRWHLDEVFLKINGRLHYLWRAVDQDGDVLDILVQTRREALPQKSEISLRSAKGAEYDSQGQAPSRARRVAPGSTRKQP